MTLSPIDWAILSAYLAFLAYIMVKIGLGGAVSSESYLLDGRRLTLPAFVATTVSTWYGGILGVGEYSYNHGLSNWLVFGVPYYLAALLFAFLIAERARRSQLLTIPDQLDLAYGGRVAVGGALYVFVMTVPAVYVLMLGVLLNLLFGWSLPVGVVVATIVSTCYVLVGGFRSVVKTDWVQFSLMYLAFGVMAVVLLSEHGGLSFLRSHLPAEHFNWRGGKTAAYVISWYFIALAALVEPAFYQRCYAARSPRIARQGILVSVLFWLLFDFLTTTVGMYSRAILGDGINGVAAFPLLADRVLPPGLKGLFLVGLATTIQSTVDSYSHLAATTLGRDVLWRIRAVRRRFGEIPLSRYCLVASGLLAIGIALFSGSVVDIWHRLGSIGTPGLLLPLGLSYSKRLRFRPGWALVHLMVVPVVVGGWFLAQAGIQSPPFPLSIQPIFPGLMTSVVILALDHLTRSRNRAQEMEDSFHELH